MVGVNSPILGSGLPLGEKMWLFLEREIAVPVAAPTISIMHQPGDSRQICAMLSEFRHSCSGRRLSSVCWQKGTRWIVIRARTVVLNGEARLTRVYLGLIAADPHNGAAGSIKRRHHGATKTTVGEVQLSVSVSPPALVRNRVFTAT